MSANTTNILAEPGKQEILITREFDASRELVFKACTDPQLIPQWWGPRYLSTEVDKMDVRPGESGALSIETLREKHTRFTACITKSLPLSALLIPLSLKGYRKQ